MELIISNNHFILHLDGRNYVLDTGSPVSFNYYNGNALEINGKRFAFSSPVICPQKAVNDLTGMTIDGLIGTDIMKQTGLLIDIENMTVVFSSHAPADPEGRYASISFQYFMGMYLITNDVILGRRLQNAIIDTGAPVPYVSSALLSCFEPTGEKYEDFSPTFGVLKGEYRRGELILPCEDQEYKRSIKIGQMPGLLDAFSQFDAILGITALSEKQVLFDFNTMKIRIKL